MYMYMHIHILSYAYDNNKQTANSEEIRMIGYNNDLPCRLSNSWNQEGHSELYHWICQHNDSNNKSKNNKYWIIAGTKRASFSSTDPHICIFDVPSMKLAWKINYTFVTPFIGDIDAFLFNQVFICNLGVVFFHQNHDASPNNTQPWKFSLQPVPFFLPEKLYEELLPCFDYIGDLVDIVLAYIEFPTVDEHNIKDCLPGLPANSRFACDGYANVLVFAAGLDTKYYSLYFEWCQLVESEQLSFHDSSKLFFKS
ncbi:hypothetical protein RFI_38951 [Reticulomyxa filosa]|uniref:Uncharacterized protein n=1 Tax=Reticulomyxa filosa TaxID=46433 RepID=X6LBM4_RETFI|nr:hypothetical protein RFI_38951 [Reticulomyxa filosa]|eukprot:ETN98541.1 hypothetical protein RFI_38951 [Reticulomyxa filosa]